MISKNLIYLRNQKELSQDKLAKLTGISQSAIAKWELNKAEATETNLITLANFFKVTVDYLLGLEDNQSLLPADTQTHNEETMFKADKSKINYNYKKSK